MLQQRLLSDIKGRIKHVLITSNDGVYARQVSTILKSFDPDVEATIVYQGSPTDTVPDKWRAKAKRFLGRGSHLERLVAEIDSSRKVNFLPVEHDVWPWIRDCVHVLEGKGVASSFPSRTIPYSNRQQAQQTSLDIVANSFWEEHGFRVMSNGNFRYPAEGGDILVSGDTIFMGTNHMANYFMRDKGVVPVSRMKSKDYSSSQELLLEALRAVDSERSVHWVGIAQKVLQHHIDMLFTPINDHSVVIADIHSTLNYLDLPKEVRVLEIYQALANDIDAIAKKFEAHYDVSRIPYLPRLYIAGDNGGEKRYESSRKGQVDVLPTSLSFNNVLQESYEQDGQTHHTIYMPIYPPRAFPPIDPAKLTKIQLDAHDAYTALGLKVRPILFDTLPGQDGALRCGMLVLERA